MCSPSRMGLFHHAPLPRRFLDQLDIGSARNGVCPEHLVAERGQRLNEQSRRVGVSEKLHACRRNGSEYICTSESISAA